MGPVCQELFSRCDANRQISSWVAVGPRGLLDDLESPKIL